MHLPNLQYDCVSCGKGCTEFQVEVASQDLPRLRSSPTTLALERAGFVPLQVVGDQVFVEKVDGGRCRYLNEETLCSLHLDGGFSHKPKTCQDFPFVPVATPDGIYIGASFFCTAVAESRGRPLDGRQEEFAYLLKSPECEDVAADSQWSLWGEQAVDWSNYLRIEQFCRSALDGDPRHGLLQAAWRFGSTVTKGDPSYLSKPLESGTIPLDSLQHLARKMIPMMESTDESVAQAISAALAEDKGFDSPALGHWVVLVSPPTNSPDWLNRELVRYFEHVLFRKSLLRAPNVLSRVCLLVIACELLITYAYSRAAHRKSEIEPEDYFKAVGLIEGRLMLHAHGMEEAIGECALGFLSLEASSPELV